MKNIDYRLDLDNAMREFALKSDKEDFVMFFRHNFKDNEGVVYTSLGKTEDVPFIAEEDIEQTMGDVDMFLHFKDLILTLAAQILSDKELKEKFLEIIEEEC